MPATPPPPPPPPPVEDTAAAPVATPPPPPPPPETQDVSTPAPPPLPPPTSATQPQEPTASSQPKPVSDQQNSIPEQDDQLPPRPRRKRRFSPSAQDPVPVQTPTLATPTSSSRIHQSSNATTTAASSTTSSSTGSKPLTANEWEKTAFVGDASGEKRMKFLRLMGLGKSTKIEAKPENADDASREASRRQQQSYDMERQYEQGRKRQHRFK